MKYSQKYKSEFKLENFVEAYLKGDELYLKLAICAKRYAEGEKEELIRI